MSDPLPRHQHHGTPDDELARKEAEAPPTASEKPARRPNFYREVGLKEGQGSETLPDIDRTDEVDVSQADEHQPEGPGGKGF